MEQNGQPVHGLFYRRMFWLVLFGLTIIINGLARLLVAGTSRASAQSA